MYCKEYFFLMYGFGITNVDGSNPQIVGTRPGSLAMLYACTYTQTHLDIISFEALSVFRNYALCHRNHLKHFFQNVTALFGL